tara:strand:- start:660 stop:956 length:297 start_codon:yes stop_codon:yes gene_type:complete
MSKTKEELKEEALKWAESRVEGVILAFSDPIRGMNGEEKKIYESLKEWGLELPELSSEQLSVVKVVLAMDKFKKLDEKNGKRKLSKWEVVTGKRLNRE